MVLKSNMWKNDDAANKIICEKKDFTYRRIPVFVDIVVECVSKSLITPALDIK